MIHSSRRPHAAVLALVGLTLLLAGCGAAPPAALPIPGAAAAAPTNTVAGSYPAPVLGLVVGPNLRVVGVEPGSGAAHAGVQPDDVLVALDGTALTSAEQGQAVAQAAAVPGSPPVRVAVRRAGQDLTILVQPAPPVPLGSFDAPAVGTATPLPPGYGSY